MSLEDIISDNQNEELNEYLMSMYNKIAISEPDKKVCKIKY